MACFLWVVVVGGLDDVVCDGWRPVFDNIHNPGEPWVEELLLPGSSCDDDVQGCFCGRVGRYAGHTPEEQTLL